MADADLIIENGTVVTEGGTFNAALIVANGQIVAYAGNASDWHAPQHIDASGLLVMPGGIDVHTHFEEPDPELLMDYVVPFIEPLRHESFHFTRTWMQAQAARMSNFSSEESKLARNLNLPPAYLLIHRVWLGCVGVLCQLGGNVATRAEIERWVPGFAV